MFVPGTAFSLVSVPTGGQLVGGRGIFQGAVIDVTAGAAFAVKLFDGPPANGQLVYSAVYDTVNYNDSQWLPNDGVVFVRGLFVVYTGTVLGSAFVVPETRISSEWVAQRGEGGDSVRESWDTISRSIFL